MANEAAGRRQWHFVEDPNDNYGGKNGRKKTMNRRIERAADAGLSRQTAHNEHLYMKID